MGVSPNQEGSLWRRGRQGSHLQNNFWKGSRSAATVGPGKTPPREAVFRVQRSVAPRVRGGGGGSARCPAVRDRKVVPELARGREAHGGLGNASMPAPRRERPTKVWAREVRGPLSQAEMECAGGVNRMTGNVREEWTLGSNWGESNLWRVRTKKRGDCRCGWGWEIRLQSRWCVFFAANAVWDPAAGILVRSAWRWELEDLVWRSASPLTCFITKVLHFSFITDKIGELPFS